MNTQSMRPFSTIAQEDAQRIKWVLCDIDDTITTAGKLTKASYGALWDLKNAGFGLIPVTGRPAGWCDMIIREWPVDAVIGENGAFAMYFDGPVLRRFLHPEVAPDAQERLAGIRREIITAVPGCRIAKDQFSRIYDLAIDFAEDEPRLSLNEAEKIRDFCIARGAEAKISSIHVNTWFGKYDKVGMAGLYFSQILGIENPEDCCIFFGDSPNDEPMFSRFSMSCAVANILPFADKISHLPAYVTALPGADGFAEAAKRLISLKKGN